jgi:hypothetical protein
MCGFDEGQLCLGLELHVAEGPVSQVASTEAALAIPSGNTKLQDSSPPTPLSSSDKSSSPPQREVQPGAGDAFDGPAEASAATAVAVFLQFANCSTMPCLADLEHAAQAINLFLEKAPRNRTVTLENDLYVTPFGIANPQGATPLPGCSSHDPASALHELPSLSGASRASLPWKMAPTLPLLSSQLRVTRAEPASGGINTFVTFRHPPSLGFKTFFLGALLALAGVIAYVTLAARNPRLRADVAMHAIWPCVAACALAACIIVLDKIVGKDPEDLGLQLWGSRSWRLHWPHQTMLGISTVWHLLSGSSGATASGDMNDLLGAKV